MSLFSRDGLGRTAVYCTVVSLIEQLEEEKVIDVFQTVLRLRAVNPNMMYSLVRCLCVDLDINNDLPLPKTFCKASKRLTENKNP